MTQRGNRVNAEDTRRTDLSKARRYRGFTLIELVVVIAILSIIAGIAYPSYLGVVSRTSRSAGKSTLLEVANRQEQYFAENKSYASDLSDLGYTGNYFMINARGDSVAAASSERCYGISLTNTAAMTYTVNAIPQLQQADHDAQCATLTLTHTGIRGQSGASTKCW